MSETAPAPQFMLLLHEDPASYRHMGPDEMQRIVEEYSAWAGTLAERGQLVRGVKLTNDGGRHVRAASPAAPALVTDGPYAEGKELIGGYFVVQADGYAAAVAIARGCPHLANGWVEVRAVDPV